MRSFSNFRQINEQVDNIIAESITQEHLKEGKVDDIKQQIIDFLDEVHDVGLLHSVLSRLNRKLLEAHKNDLAERISPSNADEVINFVEEARADIDDKQEFMSIVGKGTGIDGKKVLNATKRTSFDDIVSNRLKGNATYQSIKGKLLRQKNFTSPGSKGIGDGELFLSILSKDIGADPADKGDIAVSGKSVEVKAQGARLRGQKGFAAGSGAKVKENLVQELSTLTGEQVDDNRSLSFKPRGDLSFLNGILKGQDAKEVRAIFARAFEGLYPQIKSGTLNKWLKKIVQNDGTLAQDSEFLVAGMIFDYYKSLEGFESILFLNSKKGVFQVIPDGETLVQNQKNFKITGFVRWDSSIDRESVVSIELQ